MIERITYIYVISSILAFLGSYLLALFVCLKGHSGARKDFFILSSLCAGTWCFFPAAKFLVFPDFLIRLIYSAGLFSAPAFLKFGLLMSENPLGERERKLVKYSFIIATIFFPLLFTRLLIQRFPFDSSVFFFIPGILYPFFILFFVIVCSLAFLNLLFIYKNSYGIKKNQLKYVLLAYFMAFVSALMHFGTGYGIKEIFPHDILVLVAVIILAYSAFRYRLMDVKVAISRLGIFVFVYALVLGVPFGLGFYYIGKGLWLLPVSIMALLATAGPFFYFYLQKKAEEHLLREDLRVQSFLIQSSYGMTAIHDLKKLLQFIRETMVRTLDLDRAEIFMLDQAALAYEAAGPHRHPARFRTDEPVVEFLQTQTVPVLYDEVRMRCESQKDSRYDQGICRMMSAFGFQAVIPILMGGILGGFAGLGRRRSNEPFSRGMLNALSVFGHQAALAIENCRHIEAESRRMQEEGFQERIASLDMMASSFAHEIDNPMGIINGQVDCLGMVLDDRRVFMPPEVRNSIKESFQHILGASRRVSGMVKAILEYSRMGTGELKPVSMSDVCESFLHLMGPQIKTEEIECRISVAEDLPFVLGDKVQLEEILMNFASNSIYALRGREPRQIHVRIFRKDDKTIRMEFEDNGQGIPAHLLKDAFLASVTTKGSSEGTGLGLFRVRKIADLHHAQVWAQRRDPLDGTLMVFEIPVFEEDIQKAVDDQGCGLEGPRALF